VLEATEQAIGTRRQEGAMDLNDVVRHTDTGSQYTSIRFTELLGQAAGQPSLGAVGTCSYDDPLASSMRLVQRGEAGNRHRMGFSVALDRALITGKAGVIGSTLADHLLACDPSVEVVGINRFTPTP
jgi:transposase InsO family protein